MKCNAEAYGGSDPFVFVGVAGRDLLRASPLLERLALEGFRLWYYDGENQAQAASRLESCSACLFLVSEEAAQQHSFLNRIIYAMSRSLPVVAAFWEDFPKTAGLTLQLAALPCLQIDGDAFYKKLAGLPALREIRMPGARLKGAAFADWQAREAQFLNEYQLARAARKPVKEAKRTPLVPPKGEELPHLEAPAPRPRGRWHIIRLSTGQSYELYEAAVTLGRAGAGADIAFDGTRAISRSHARLYPEGNGWLLRDSGSKYGTYANGAQLIGDMAAQLNDGAVFTLANEEFRLEFLPAPSVQEDDEDTTTTGSSPREPVAFFQEPEEAPDLVRPASRAQEPLAPVPSEASQPPEPEEAPSIRRPFFAPPAEEPPAAERGADHSLRASAAYDDVDEMTVRIQRKPLRPEEDPDRTVRQKILPSALLRLGTGELFLLPQVENVIGRKTERKRADIMLDGNAELSREHAVIYQYLGKFLIRDCGSLTGTFVDDSPVSQTRATELKDMTNIQMAGESFLFVTGQTLQTLKKRGKYCWIQSLDSGVKKPLLEDRIPLDRQHPLSDGLLAKETVSRHHLVLEWKDGGYAVRDAGSTNGSRVGDTDLVPDGEGVALRSDDRFWAYDVGFCYAELALKGDAIKC